MIISSLAHGLIAEMSDASVAGDGCRLPLLLSAVTAARRRWMISGQWQGRSRRSTVICVGRASFTELLRLT
jgi:hypothetical protein